MKLKTFSALSTVLIVTGTLAAGELLLPPLSLDLAISGPTQAFGNGLGKVAGDAVLSRAANPDFRPDPASGREEVSGRLGLPPLRLAELSSLERWGAALDDSLGPRLAFAQEEAPVAQQPPPAEPAGGGGAPGRLSARGAIGFTLDPDAFLLAFQGDYFINDSLAAGPLVQLAVDDDNLILAPTVNVQYQFDLAELGEGGALDNLKPFLQGGIGFAYINKDFRGGDVDDVGFLFNLGFGFDYYLAENFALGNNLLFNVLPDDVVGENFFFSWQFLTARFRF